MIKKYLHFIGESFSDDYETIGEYIESLYGGNSNILKIVAEYTQDIDPTIKLANAINILDKNKQELLLNKINQYIDSKKVGEQITESMESIPGKNLFTCYLKIFTACGLKDTKVSWDKTPSDFLIYFLSKTVNIDSTKNIMSRYRQFDKFINAADYTHNDCELYYGIKCDGTFEYGIRTDDQIIPVGKFTLTKGILNWLILLNSPSANNLKKVLVGLDLNKILLLSKIKTEILKANIIQSDNRSNPTIDDNIMTFGFYGVGNWSDGMMDNNDFEKAKNDFKIYLSKYQWSSKIQVSITASNFWLYINIKVK